MMQMLGHLYEKLLEHARDRRPIRWEKIVGVYVYNWGQVGKKLVERMIILGHFDEKWKVGQITLIAEAYPPSWPLLSNN